MIEGITVLNQCDVVMGFGIWSFISILAIGITFIVLLIVMEIRKYKLVNVSCIALVLSMICFVVSLAIYSVTPTGRFRYECTIDESVSMTEVYERYEIIEQRGDIWVLEDKE